MAHILPRPSPKEKAAEELREAVLKLNRKCVLAKLGQYLERARNGRLSPDATLLMTSAGRLEFKVEPLTPVLCEELERLNKSTMFDDLATCWVAARKAGLEPEVTLSTVNAPEIEMIVLLRTAP